MFAVGPFLIVVSLFGGPVAFSASILGTATASAVIYYTFLIPYLAILSFLIVGKSGVPPAYRFFQFFIASSGRRHIDAALGDQGGNFDVRGFHRTVAGSRGDRHQAKLEAEELRAASGRVRDATRQRYKKIAQISAAEEERVRAAEESLREVEAHHRAKARETAIRNRRGQR